MFGFLNGHNADIALRMSQKSRIQELVSAKDENSCFGKLEFTKLRVRIDNQNIYNYDEPNLSDDPCVEKCNFNRGVQYPERIQNRSRCAPSIMFCGSATREMLCAFVVYKADKIWTSIYQIQLM